MRKQGFSLVEVSIVLVVLGLLIGGVIAGQNLIRAAAIRSIATDYNKYSTAVFQFTDQYGLMPGDITNATDFWGAAAVCPGDHDNPSTDQRTCNGTGDDVIGHYSTSDSRNYEKHRLWQHLANAGLVEGSFTGVNADAGGHVQEVSHSTPGENMPASKIENAGFSVIALHAPSMLSPTAWFFPMAGGNYFVFGADTGATTNTKPAITPEEAWSVDNKIDDGQPDSGNVVAYRNGATTANAQCADSDATDGSAEYKVADTDLECALFMGVWR